MNDVDRIIGLTGAEDSSGLRAALAKVLAATVGKAYAHGYEQGQVDAANLEHYNPGECPFTHSHTRHWCGYATCRDS